MTPVEQHRLAGIIYSVWFGMTAPFSISMKEELLTPIHPPVVVAPEAVTAALTYSGSQPPSSTCVLSKEETTLLEMIEEVSKDDSSSPTLEGTL